MKKIIDYCMGLVVSRIVLWVGIVTIMSSLLYMISNITRADSIITMWASSMAIGVCFIVIGVFMNRMMKSQKKAKELKSSLI